jgi:uncharacterized damage-inducible protein DinB
MTAKDYLLGELAREIDRSRRVLEHVPDGRWEWKPHDKSMICGYLANMVATIPSWIAMQVTRDDLDVAPKDGKSAMTMEKNDTSGKLLRALEKSAADARQALQQTSDDHLKTKWQLKAGRQVVQEAPRVEMIQDTFNHWAHHRGQLTVYLRLMGAKVPAIYGPSADDKSFG